jgi:hypothetical protein
VDAQAALALRPKQSDRVGFLVAWDYGDTSPVIATAATPGNRVSRASLDGYYQVTSRLEFYQRVAMLRTDMGAVLGSPTKLLWQDRLQYRLSNRFDLAGELRWTKQRGTVSDSRPIGAVELAYWVSADLRAGIGYTTRPWTSFGPSLKTEPGSGNFYLVFTSRLSSLFNLFDRRAAPTPRTTGAAGGRRPGTPE